MELHWCILLAVDVASACGRVRRGANDSTSVLLGYTFMNFRREKAIGGNVAVQFAATPQTQVWRGSRGAALCSGC